MEPVDLCPSDWTRSNGRAQTIHIHTYTYIHTHIYTVYIYGCKQYIPTIYLPKTFWLFFPFRMTCNCLNESVVSEKLMHSRKCMVLRILFWIQGFSGLENKAVFDRGQYRFIETKYHIWIGYCAGFLQKYLSLKSILLINMGSPRGAAPCDRKGSSVGWDGMGGLFGPHLSHHTSSCRATLFAVGMRFFVYSDHLEILVLVWKRFKKQNGNSVAVALGNSCLVSLLLLSAQC